MPYSELEAKPIQELCQIIDCEHKTAPYIDSSDFHVVRTSNVRDGQLLMAEMKYTTAEAYKSWTQRAEPEAGDILFTREAPAGETCLVPPGIKICMGQRLVMLRPDRNKLEPLFLARVLTTDKYKFKIQRLSIGSTVSRINISDIKSLTVPSPPLTEQKKIAQILSTWDKAITTTEQLLANSQQQKKALMQQLLTGKKRLLDENGLRCSEEWTPEKVGSTSRCFSGGTPSRTRDDYFGGSIPWITSSHLNDRFIDKAGEYITQEGLENSAAKLVSRGSILIAMYGATAGKVAINNIERATTNQAILALEPYDSIDSLFLFYLLEMEMNKALSLVQGGQPNLNAKIIKNIKLLIPTIEKQKRIASIIATADKEVKHIKQNLERMKREEKALMQQLLTGKRRVEVDEEAA